MQELLEQAIDYLKGIWLKRRYIIISTWLVCPLGWVMVSQMDDVYESEATVYVDTQSLLKPLLKGISVDSDADYQVANKLQTLKGRENLKRIIRMTDLDIQAKNEQEFEAIVERLNEDLKITRAGRKNIYTISIQDKNPEMAKEIVKSTLTIFIENSLGESRSDTEGATRFLDEQIKEYENRLLASEAKLTAFKQKYSNVLMNNEGGYYAALNDTKGLLKKAELELSEAETRLVSAKAQLVGENPVFGLFSSSKVQTENSVSTTYDTRIAQLEENLDGLMVRYTEEHPDVKELKGRLEQLNKLRDKELEQYYQSLQSSTSSASPSFGSVDQNPVYQELKIQVNTFENEVASLKVRVKSYQDTLQDLENKIHTLPEIEAELVSLTRGYDINKEQHDELLKRKERAKLAKKAEETTEKISFEVINPARVPTEPVGPPRLLFLIGVTIIGVGVGVGLSLLFSQINPVVTSRNQVTRATGIPVFGVVSATEKLGLQTWHKKKTLIFVASNTMLFFVFMFFIAYALFPEEISAPLKGIL